jgi:hypothetical protein
VDSPSAVVQAALSRFAGGGRGTTEYAVRPELNGELSAALEAARAHIVSEARELYQHGYREGLDLAGKLDFRQLAYIVRVGAKEAAQNQASVAFDFDTGRLDRATHGGPLIEPRERGFSHAGQTRVSRWSGSSPTTACLDVREYRAVLLPPEAASRQQR